MQNQSGHTRTWQTEIYGGATALAACYQAYQLDTINPAAIGEAVTHLSVLLSIAIPAMLLWGRLTWKKFFRKDKRRASDVASDVVNADRELDK